MRSTAEPIQRVVAILHDVLHTPEPIGVLLADAEHGERLRPCRTREAHDKRDEQTFPMHHSFPP
jgi:hypothetical protein